MLFKYSREARILKIFKSRTCDQKKLSAAVSNFERIIASTIAKYKAPPNSIQIESNMQDPHKHKHIDDKQSMRANTESHNPKLFHFYMGLKWRS